MSSFDSPEDMASAQAVWGRYCGHLTDEEIQTGLDRCIKISDWSPNVSEFLRMAKGLPDENETISRVLADNCFDPVSKAIRKSIGTWDIGHQPPQVIISRIRGSYNDAYLEAVG